MGSGDAAADGGSDDAQFRHKLGESGGIVVDFDEQAVGASGNGGASHGRDFVATAGAVRGVANHWQMGKLLDDRDGGDVEGVARVGFERADAALAEDDVVIAAGEDVLRAEEKLF